ncbi:MAG TPA: PH domain-containing protein [Pseudonocardiaceae bacterium]|nr:PH domain-containing protein [Pseudonocardiaceae bacterium]
MVESIPRRLVFRIPGVALVGVLFALASMSVLALAGPKLLLLTYLIPIGVGVWVMRTRTVVQADQIRVRRLLTARRIDWAELTGLRVRERKWVRAVLANGAEVTLPCVKPRHLPVLALLSGGRLADPTERPEAPPAAAPNDQAPVPPWLASGTGANA